MSMLSQKDGSVTYTLPGNVSHLSVLAINDFDIHYEVKKLTKQNCLVSLFLYVKFSAKLISP